MTDHFLTDIEIKEFKCFKDFKAAGFKRVNLIGGKNNIGKTVFMEACYINRYTHDLYSAIEVICDIELTRKAASLVGIDEHDINYDKMLNEAGSYNAIGICKIDSKPVSFHISKNKTFGKQYYVQIWGSNHSYSTEKISKPETVIDSIYSKRILFVSGFGWSNKLLSILYQFIQINDKEQELNTVVKEFDENIESFKIIGDKPECKIDGKYQDIDKFGDGFKHYISIICALYACENGYLFIDEIDNGIHYTQLDRLWELILTLSKQTNCQVFATTHSKEMLESFARVSKKLNEQDISYTILVKNKQQEIKTISLDYEMLLDSVLEQGHEVR